MSEIWAVVPVKAVAAAKQRLAGLLGPAQRQELALAMLGDVLATLAASSGLAGIVVATIDAQAAEIARGFGAVLSREDADIGHSEAVAACARTLARSGAAMLTLPADIPLVVPDDIAALLAGERQAPSFAITPSRNARGSNAVLCAPADVVPLRFGDDSFRPHLAAALASGIAPRIVRLPRAALDIDRPEDVMALLAVEQQTRARAVLERGGFAGLRQEARG